MSVHTVIKTTFKSFLKNDLKVKEIINDAVFRMHQLTSEVYRFIKIYFINCIDNNIDISKLILNNDKNNLFIRNCYALLSNQKGQKGNRTTFNNEILNFYNVFYSKLVPEKKVSCKNLSFIRNEEATQISTSFLNNIKFHYYSRLLKLVKKNFNFTRKDNYLAHKIVKDMLLLNEEYESDMKYHKWINKNRYTYVPKFTSSDDNYFQLIKKYNENLKKFKKTNKNLNEDKIKIKFRKKYGKKPIHPYYDDLENKSMIFQKPMVKISHKLEELGVKNIRAIPCRTSFISKSIKITTNALYDLIDRRNFSEDFKNKFKNKIDITFKKDIKKLPKKRQDEINKLTDYRKEKEYKKLYKEELKAYEKAYWSKYFNVNKFENKKKSKGFKFKNILTNGVSVSIFFEKQGKKIKEENYIREFKYVDELNEEERKNILENTYFSVDPGVNSIITCINTKQKVVTYTRQQRRIEAYFKRSKQIRVKNLTKEIRKKIENLSKHSSSKSCDFIKFSMYIRLRNKYDDKMYKHYNIELYKKLLFRRHVMKQKSESLLVKRLKDEYKEKNKELIALYGDWSRPKGLKCGGPTPGIGIRRLFRRNNIKVYLVDEFRSSKLSYCCKKETENFLKRENPKPYRKEIKLVHSLLRCKNVSCNKLWNRDVMACENILNNGIKHLKGEKVEECFQRKQITNK